MSFDYITGGPTIFAEYGGYDVDTEKKIADSGYKTKKRLRQLWTQLDNERSTWVSHYTDLADFILPRRVRFNISDRNKGDKRNQKIINNTATIAARTLRSGMQAGVTSPARPWMRLTTYDPSLAEYDAVKYWLHDVTGLMNTIMLRSNLYNSTPVVYGDLGVFGTSAMIVLEDDLKVMRTFVPPVGSYVISANERGIVDLFARECEMTARQIVMRFAKRADKSGTIIWDNISNTVRQLWMNDNFEVAVPVKHFVMPNDTYDSDAIDPQFKKYKSCYFEDAEAPDQFLSQSGFDEFPVLAPRWDVLGEDVYGYSPGMDALGDTKALQVMERRKAQANEKKVNPPMTGPSSLRNQKATLLAGDITFTDVRDGQQGFRPAHEVNFSVKELMLDVQEHQRRIQRAFYEDLFLMLTLSDRREITAREIQERHEEKLLMLGPVLERLNDEMLDPLIDRTFAIMNRAGLIPPPPQELEGLPLKVEYTSVMAQAQKLVSVGTMERFATFVRATAEVNPEILDKVDTDQMIDEYANMTGVVPRVVRSDDQVAQIRDRRQKMQEAQMKSENIERMAKAGKAMSTSPMDQDNVLNRVLDNVGNGVVQ